MERLPKFTYSDLKKLNFKYIYQELSEGWEGNLLDILKIDNIHDREKYNLILWRPEYLPFEPALAFIIWSIEYLHKHIGGLADSIEIIKNSDSSQIDEEIIRIRRMENDINDAYPKFLDFPQAEFLKYYNRKSQLMHPYSIVKNILTLIKVQSVQCTPFSILSSLELWKPEDKESIHINEQWKQLKIGRLIEILENHHKNTAS